MRTYSLKAGVMLVGAALLATAAAGCQGSVAAAPALPVTPTAPPPVVIATQPTLPSAPPANAPSSAPPTQQYPAEQQFDLINGSSLAMNNFYAEPTDVAGWGDDSLGDYVLRPNETTPININDNRQTCMYDFLAIFEDGSQLEVDGVDICELSSYTFMD